MSQVVDAIYDCKSEVIGPGFFRFKAEIGDLSCFWFSVIHEIVEIACLLNDILYYDDQKGSARLQMLFANDGRSQM